ncbi:hypothetical protein QN219_00690 [Sinorhizobium sp. 7-81]|uniref:hypothetical protein n=1 Tax=Sinorhizobium sp. 8-89 TaxID=3049089 RepID=UPI0024C39576|nr:hypothetical protein [Sinorhizobium sp. 8-89]MDK1488583.1 hypothetical protein [Sinorhizobium sp. 8-89]
MADLEKNHRRYDLHEELERALNRVDFFRIFHTLALRFGFGHFGVLQLGNENDPAYFPLD